jgi:hypothetical protein
MIERLIESWLTETDERGFQIPYAQVLQSQGFSILHIASHGPDEQGKDLVGRRPDGTLVAYQIKVGDIDLGRLRREVWPEVEALLDLPIHHPSVPEGSEHESFLVVTGEIKDPVRREIDDHNRDRRNRGKREVRTITHGELLTAFAGAATPFLPKAVPDLTRLFNLYTSNGREPLPRPEFARYLESVAPHDGTERRAVPRAAAAAQIYTAYALRSKEREGNHWAVCDGWIMSCLHILSLVEKHHAFDDDADVIALALRAIGSAFEKMEEDWCQRGNFLEGGTLLDGKFVTYRAGIVLGYLAGGSLFRIVRNQPDPVSARALEKMKGAFAEAKLFSEGIGPSFLNYLWLLETQGDREGGETLLRVLVDAILLANIRKEGGLISPYYEVEDVIRALLGLRSAVRDERFQGTSFLLETLVYMAAGRDMRTYLSKRWKQISHMQVSEFVPANAWQEMLYRSSEGEERSRFFAQTQSWKALGEEALARRSERFPEALERYPEIIPLLFLTHPHR